jgi:uncharacterized protein YjlB
MTTPQAINLADDGTIPNSPLPLLLYENAFEADVGPARLEQVLRKNNWRGLWRNGVFPYHHYHSTSHEVLACAAGKATVLFGGPSGRELSVTAGSVVVIPAGVAHKRIAASGDFLVIGGYPNGRSWDMNYARPDERSAALANIRAVPLPETDPLSGPDGPLVKLWRSASDHGTAPNGGTAGAPGRGNPGDSAPGGRP